MKVVIQQSQLAHGGVSVVARAVTPPLNLACAFEHSH